MAVMFFSDPKTHPPNDLNSKKAVFVQGSSGRRKVDTRKYIDFSNDIVQPVLLCHLSDDVNGYANYKRTKTSVENTAKYLKETIEYMQETESEPKLLGVVQGSNYPSLRRESVRMTTIHNKSLFGYMLNGFNQGGNIESTANADLSLLNELHKAYLVKYPAEDDSSPYSESVAENKALINRVVSAGLNESSILSRLLKETILD